jgi:hypothetical protein
MIAGGCWANESWAASGPRSAPIRAASSRCTTPTSAWPGERADHFFAQRFFFYLADEFAHGRQRHVGLEQRQAHLAQHLGGVRFGQSRLAAHGLDDFGEALGQVIQHDGYLFIRAFVETAILPDMAGFSLLPGDPAHGYASYWFDTSCSAVYLFYMQHKYAAEDM